MSTQRFDSVIAFPAMHVGGFVHHGEGFHLEIKRWLLEHEQAL